MSFKTYSELSQLATLEDRYDYLRLGGRVGEITFGFERFLNQDFYRSREWRDIRHHVAVRDQANDMGLQGYPITGRVYVHHMNPMTPEQLEHGDSDILNMDYLISVSHRTHNAIHYGDRSLLPQPVVVRRPGDTNLW